jgi:quinolinate synthase
VGEHGGAVCTSSNARNVLEWAMEGSGAGVQGSGGSKTKILFFPDQHLGRNTAYAMGYPLERMVVWDPRKDLGGNDPQALIDADFLLWKGHCSVHALFRPEHVDQVRQKYPGMKVLQA